MNEIYYLVGLLLHNFQKLESYLTLSVYTLYKKQLCDDVLRNDILNKFNEMYDKSLGYKLSIIKTIDFLDSSDILILDYLKNKRNYIVHHFFTDNEFDSAILEIRIQELQQLLHDIQIIEKAFLNFLCNSAK